MDCEEFIHPVLHQERVDNPQKRHVRCLTCERRCVIAPGETGWCGTHQNRDGVLVTLTYGMVTSLSANRIEKKPLYHFYPGSRALTTGSSSCNFACPWCQNWHISKALPRGGTFYSPSSFVAEAINRDCQGTSISFNEPTLSLEWVCEVFRLTRQAGLYNTFVTNGYMTLNVLERLAHAGLDAMNVDVKGDVNVVQTHCEADVEVVWRNLVAARDLGIWLEVTTLVIPSINDNSEILVSIAERIKRTLGADTPWHVTRYHPTEHFHIPPTPLATLEHARSIGREVGLKYVYVGNAPGHYAENTYCPSCKKMLIQRWEIPTTGNQIRKGRCPECGTEIPGCGLNWQK
ncbi:MAG: AmmeMemoRadiSam system radical SAM enzyme [Anaerolineae bacterium]|nr:AmmeMemoRadiSam system radical SAM enzyme [Anaerolineae bacterium]